MRAWAWILACLVGLSGTLTLPGCGDSPDPSPGHDAQPLLVVTTIAPLKGLVEGVAPGNTVVRVLIPPGASPHGYQPTPADAEALRRAGLVVAVGLGVEGGLSTAIERNVAGTRHAVVFARVIGLEGDGHDHAHAHEDGDDHADDDDAHHHAIDPHLWVDPGLVLQLIDALERELAAISPAEASVIHDRAEAVRARVKALDEELTETLAPVRGKSIVTDHDAFGRFCDRYGIQVAAVVRPFEGAEPTPGELAKVRDAVTHGGAAGVFVEPQFDARAARMIADAAGVPVGTLDPIGTGDWFAMMRANASELARVLTDPGGNP